MPTIHEKICALRKASGLTQEQLGAKLGISGQAVSKWEKGESMPDILLLPELCDLFGITTDELLRNHSAEPAQKSDEKDDDNEKVIREFCRYARETGRNAAIVDAVNRLVGDEGKESPYDTIVYFPDGIRLNNRAGMSFVVSNRAFMEQLISADPEKIAYFLRILTDPVCLRVLGCMSPDRAMTQEEIYSAMTVWQNHSPDAETLHQELTDELREVLSKVGSSRLSTSLIQRKCSCGYGKAADYITQLKEAGVIEPFRDSNYLYRVKTEPENRGIDLNTITRILLGLMKRDIICCEEDTEGNFGYLWNLNMAGVIMILAGCHAAGYGVKVEENPYNSLISRFPHSEQSFSDPI